jgi:hypothetical protein
LAIHAKGGESSSPKQKDPHHHQFQKYVQMMKFFEVISYCFQKEGENSIFKIGILKPS